MMCVILVGAVGFVVANKCIKPMLAATLSSLDTVKLPVYVSPKLDGIRCLILNGKAVSRKLKPIPNKYIQECLKGLPEGLDGELVLKEGDFNTIQSAVMSEEGKPDFTYVIFDSIFSTQPYAIKLFDIKVLLNIQKRKHVDIIENTLVKTCEQLEALEQEYIKKGLEGIIIRSLNSSYKFGRSTIKEGYLLKYKRFKDSEAIVTNIQELLHNKNAKEKDNLGYSKRSSAKTGLISSGMCGSLLVFDEKLNAYFSIGTGFTQDQRKEIWDNRKKYIGQQVTYTYQELSKSGVPRFPSFKGFRYDI